MSTQTLTPGTATLTMTGYAPVGCIAIVRVSQIALEVLEQPTDQAVRVSQIALEVLEQPTDQAARVSQIVLEVLANVYEPLPPTEPPAPPIPPHGNGKGSSGGNDKGKGNAGDRRDEKTWWQLQQNAKGRYVSTILLDTPEELFFTPVGIWETALRPAAASLSTTGLTGPRMTALYPVDGAVLALDGKGGKMLAILPVGSASLSIISSEGGAPTPVIIIGAAGASKVSVSVGLG